MAFYTIKVKAEFDVVIEAENKKEANEWASQVLPALVGLDGSYSGRFLVRNQEVKISKAKEDKLPKDVVNE